MQHDIVLKKLDFDLLTPKVRGGRVYRQNICYHIAAFRDSLLFDIQYDHVLEKLTFDLLTHPQGAGGRGVVCGQKIATMLLYPLFS